MAPIESVLITGTPVPAAAAAAVVVLAATHSSSDDGSELVEVEMPPAVHLDGRDAVALADLVPREMAAALETMTSLMGFEPSAAAAALKDHNGNVQLAVSQLIQGPLQ